MPNIIYTPQIPTVTYSEVRTYASDLMLCQKEEIESGDMIAATDLSSYNSDTTGTEISDTESPKVYADDFVVRGIDSFNYSTKSDVSRFPNGSPVGGSPESFPLKENEYIKNEKRRIQTQKYNRESKREDHFAIGTVYFKIPPTKISITDEPRTYRFNGLRSPGETIYSSGRSVTRIDLEIIFSDIEQINNQLRPLLAQFKTTPFLPIENEFVSNILNPFNLNIVGPENLKTLESQLSEMNSRSKRVNDIVTLSDAGKANNVKILGIIDDMDKKGYFTDTAKNYVIAAVVSPDSIPKERLEAGDIYYDKRSGMEKVDLKHYISKYITIGGRTQNGDMILPTMNLNEIGKLQDEINLIKSKMSSFSGDSGSMGNVSKQIVGVLSQIVVSTIPNYVNSMACRLSMYVFNYEPFTSDFAFISGYDKNAATVDINKCDLFIDWYTKRFLSDKNDLDNPSLEQYIADESFAITYTKRLDSPDNESGTKRSVDAETFKFGDGLTITGITASVKNIIQFLPILSCKNPTCQYMGSLNGDVMLTIEATDKKRVNELSRMVDTVRAFSRASNRLTRANFVRIKNSFLSTLGMASFLIDDFTVDTVPGSPGLSIINLHLIEYRVGQDWYQKLHREGVTSQKEIQVAAEYIISRARDYMLGHDEYITYYKIVCDKSGGWFSFANSKNMQGSRDPINDFVISARTDDMELSRIKSKIIKYNGSKVSLTEDVKMGLVRRPELFRDYMNLQDIDYFGRNFIDSINNPGSIIDGDSDFFFSNKNDVAKILASVRRGDIVDMILESTVSQSNSTPDLNEYLNGIRDKEDQDAGKLYCYPDLELPKYSDIPDGFRYMNTVAESGKPHFPWESQKTYQSMVCDVDPDFFMYKGSLWGIIDKSNDVFNGLKNGLETYKSLAKGNKRYRRLEAESESAWNEYLSLRQESRKESRQQSGQLTGAFELDRNIRLKIEGNDLDLARYSENDTSTINQDGVLAPQYAVGDYKVVDGDTFAVNVDGQERYVRLLGYDAPELHASDNKQVTDFYHAKLSRDVLYSAIAGKKIRLVLSPSTQDVYRRLLATVYTVNSDGSLTNINQYMLSRRSELNLNRFTSSDDPLDIENTDIFYRNHDIYMKSSNLTYVYEVFKKELSNVPVIGGIFDTVVDSSLKIGKSFLNMFNANSKTASTVVDNELLAINKYAIEKADEKSQVSVEYANVMKNHETIENKIEKSINRTSNLGNLRFDRESDSHIELISNKIRESQKDNILRMARAYPTFKLYFVEEDMPEWKRYDDLYSYQSISSVDITSSRTDASDVAVITFFNTQGTLDRSMFGIFSDSDNLFQRSENESYDRNKQETKAEQDLREFILKTGTVIKIKMGYSSDPDLLDTVFTGSVAEVSGGDMITVVAQGFGAELLNSTPKPSYRHAPMEAHKVLDDIVKCSDVIHFGKTEWLPEQSTTTKKLYRRSVYNPSTNSFVGASWWRNIYGIRHFLGIRDDTRDNNIWTPEFTWIHKLTHGGLNSIYTTQGRTIWDVFRDMTKRMPGYIATVVPFDNRATIYFGPKDFLYWYTSEKNVSSKLFDISRSDYYSMTDDKKIDSLIKDLGFKELSSEDINSRMQNLSSYLNDMSNSINSQYEYGLLQSSESMTTGGRAEQEKISNVFNAFNGKVNNKIFSNKANVVVDMVPRIDVSSQTANTVSSAYQEHILGQNRRKAASYLSTTVLSRLDNTTDDNQLKDTINFLSDSVNGGAYQDFELNKFGTVSNISYIGDTVYIDGNGKIYQRTDAIRFFDTVFKSKFDEENPRRKLISNYHFKDSYHNIISNNIIATSQYLYNKVTIEFPLETTTLFTGFGQVRSPGPITRLSVQADDDIWPEKIREKIVQEKNANSYLVAWNYGLGHLWEEMRKMYSGHLTLLGDPLIRPNDIVMLSDYYTEMFGPVEVEQVTHHFSPETGFITTIIPNLVCHVNNCLQPGSLTIAGMYMDETTRIVENFRGRASIFGFPFFSQFIGSVAGGVTFWATGLNNLRREPLSFSPLMYAGRPYVAGIEGWRKNNLFEAISGFITRKIIEKDRIFEVGGHSLEAVNDLWNRNKSNNK